MNFEELLSQCMFGERSQKRGNLLILIKLNSDLQMKMIELIELNGDSTMVELLRKKMVIEIELLKERMNDCVNWIMTCDRLAEERKLEPVKTICYCCKKIHS